MRCAAGQGVGPCEDDPLQDEGHLKDRARSDKPRHQRGARPAGCVADGELVEVADLSRCHGASARRARGTCPGPAVLAASRSLDHRGCGPTSFRHAPFGGRPAESFFSGGPVVRTAERRADRESRAARICRAQEKTVTTRRTRN